jgi:hypothetical protein
VKEFIGEFILYFLEKYQSCRDFIHFKFYLLGLSEFEVACASVHTKVKSASALKIKVFKYTVAYSK